MKNALILVDLQNDFFSGGTLAVPEAEQIVPVINALIPHFSIVLATQDCHPPDHVSFAANHERSRPGDLVEVRGTKQILWPIHCVKDSHGAQFIENLEKKNIEKIFYKGIDREIDSYSAFFDNAHLRSTGLAEYLKLKGIKEIAIAGLTTDYCVLYSTVDAIDLGFHVTIIEDACRGVNLQPGDASKALKLMKERGAHIIHSSEVLG